MPSSAMLSRVALVRTDVLDERIASLIRVARIRELATATAITSTLRSVLRLLVIANVPRSPTFVTLIMEAIHSPETSVLTRARQHSSKLPPGKHKILQKH
jgi:hypothetical protein